MNNYIKATFNIFPTEEIATDVISALLADIGFETFVNEENGLTAYAPKNNVSEKGINEIISNFPINGFSISYQIEEIEGKDWNEEWEKNYFHPIVIDDQCVIHSSFHTNIPPVRYEILIDPKMAFGTGYHQTTCHMIRAILSEDMTSKSVLDMGCGTALLAILARKHGAANVVAIDIDEFAYENALENITLNNTPDIEIRLGGAEALRQNDMFDFILANINRNILLSDIKHYATCMHSGSKLFISGFYTDDIEVLKEEALRHSLHYNGFNENEHWAMISFTKE